MSRQRKAKKVKRKSLRQRIFSFKNLISIIGLLLIVSLFILLVLDIRIRSEFEGKRWELPAKVYARPLELYAGAPLSVGDLRIELQALGYQFVDRIHAPGQAQLTANSATLSTRGFLFPDEHQYAREITLRFNGHQLTRIDALDGQNANLVRLEPALIGGIYPLNNEDRELIQLEEAPEALIDALIAIEDRDYYQHFGVSPRGIARAMWANLRAGRLVQGGSTLTQQLIKNFYLTADRSFARKMLEIPMAILLETHYSKDEILEAYLNEVYLGQSGNRAIHGFQLGAAHYFAQPLQELKLHQLALLAGLVKGPSYYDPRRHPQRAEQRRNLVLSVLHQQGSIGDAEYQRAIAAPLDVKPAGTSMKEAYPAYLQLVKRQLREDYRDEDLSSEGLRIFTSLDPISQSKAEKALLDTLAEAANQHGATAKDIQGSMVVTDPQTGEVLAMIGDRRTRNQGFNRALDAKRPIGSLVKPAIYLHAFEQGYTLMSILDDSPYTLSQPNQPDWQPQNYDRQSHGEVPLQTALSQSYNIAVARLGMTLGLNAVIDTLKKLGVEQTFSAYPSLLLGAQSLSALDVATMYQTIAAEGFNIPPRAIRTVTDSDGVALRSYPFNLQRRFDAKHVFLLQHGLIEATKTGTARRLTQQLPTDITVAGKTGTSNDLRDSWFAGYTANRLAVVWLGNDNNASLPFTGAGGALQVWSRYMASEPIQSLEAFPPAGIELYWVNAHSGLLSAAHCPDAIEVPFLHGTAPTGHAICSDNHTEPVYERENTAERSTETSPQDSNPVQRSVDWFRGLFR